MSLPDLMRREWDSLGDHLISADRILHSLLLVTRALCFVYLCWLIAKFAATTQWTLGVMLYKLAPIAVVFGTMVYIQLLLNGQIQLSLPRHVGLSWLGLLALVLTSFGLAALVAYVLGHTYSIQGVVMVLATAVMIGVSILLIINGRGVDAICVYALSWPLFKFQTHSELFAPLRYRWGLPPQLMPMQMALYLLTFVGWLQLAAKGKKVAPAYRWPGMWMLLLVGLTSTIVAPFPADAWPAYITKIILPLLVYGFFVTHVQSWTDIKKLFIAVGISGGLMALVSLYFTFYRQGSYQMVGGRYDQGHLELSLACVPPLLTMASRKWEKVFWTGIAVAIVGTIILTLGRGKLIAMALGLLPWLLPWLVSSRQGRWTAVVITTVLVATFLSMPETSAALLGRFENLTSPDNLQNERRYWIWIGAIRMFLDHPWTGLGVGMWPKSAALYGLVFLYPGAGGSPPIPVVTPHAHSTLFQLTAETGIGGVLAGLAVMWTLAQRTIGMTRTHPVEARWLVRGLQSIALILSFNFILTGFPYWEFDEVSVILCWLWFSVVMAARLFPRESDGLQESLDDASSRRIQVHI